MGEKIGYQSGIDAAVNRWIAKDPGGKVAFEKLRRTLKLLAADHDARQPATQPPPPPPPAGKLAPMTHYTTPRADARYCIAGLSKVDGAYVDARGFRYDENGLSLGGRSGKFVSVLKPADSMDGREPCEGYVKDGRSFPPWPAESYDI